MNLANTTPGQDLLLNMVEETKSGNESALLGLIETYDLRLTTALEKISRLEDELQAREDNS